MAMRVNTNPTRFGAPSSLNSKCVRVFLHNLGHEPPRSQFDPEQMAGPLRSNEGLGVVARRLGNAKQQFRHLLGNRDHCVVSG
jgi:hypothetical protein